MVGSNELHKLFQKYFRRGWAGVLSGRSHHQPARRIGGCGEHTGTEKQGCADATGAVMVPPAIGRLLSRKLHHSSTLELPVRRGSFFAELPLDDPCTVCKSSVGAAYLP